MAGPFQDAQAGMAAALRNCAGVAVTYWRGASSVELTAVVGSTSFELDDGAGAIIDADMRDYLIEAAALVLDAAATEPQDGDRIKETRGGTVYVYEVLPLGGEPCFRPSDPAGATLRVHTKLVDTE